MYIRKCLQASLCLLVCVSMVIVMSSCSKDDDQQTSPTEAAKTIGLGNSSSSNGSSGSSGSSSSNSQGMGSSTPSSSESTGSGSTGTVLISDPLTNGKSVGNVYGGTFTSSGYKLNSAYGAYLSYSTSITSANIRVEFDAKGYVTIEGTKAVVIEIFDSAHEISWAEGPAWDRYALCQVKKRDADIRVKVGAKGSWGPDPVYVGSYAWNSGATYHWVITLTNGTLDVTRNNEKIVSSLATAFTPSGKLNIRIGGSWWDAGSANVTYANVIIARM